MKKLFKCKFCRLVAEFRSELYEHIRVAHQEETIEELFYDDNQKDLEEIQEEINTSNPDKKTEVSKNG